MEASDTIAEGLAASTQAREAGDHVLRAERAALQSGDAPRAAQAARMLAMHLYRQGSSERAVQVALEAMPVIDAAGPLEASIDLRNSLTMAFVALDMPGDALPHAVEALRRARNVDSASVRGWCLNRLAIVHDCLGDTARALDLQRQAVEAADASTETDLEVAARVNLATRASASSATTGPP